MNIKSFEGVLTALVTPMYKGEICLDDLNKLIEFQIEEGINGLVPVGTTGESPTLSRQELTQIIQETVKMAAGRVPVIAGTGSNSTQETIHLTREADKLGVDGMLLVVPYYNKPSQEGLFQHFSAIAEVTEKPLVLYSIPSRCGIEIGVETIARLAEKYPNVRTIKESGGSCERVSQLKETLGKDITILSGDDGLTLPFMALGSVGVISVASNIVVKDLAKMVHSALNNDYTTARIFAEKYYRLFTDIFIEPNPVPIKYGLHQLGHIRSPEVRLPLCPLHKASEEKLMMTLKKLTSIS